MKITTPVTIYKPLSDESRTYTCEAEFLGYKTGAEALLSGISLPSPAELSFLRTHCLKNSPGLLENICLNGPRRRVQILSGQGERLEYGFNEQTGSKDYCDKEVPPIIAPLGLGSDKKTFEPVSFKIKIIPSTLITNILGKVKRWNHCDENLSISPNDYLTVPENGSEDVDAVFNDAFERERNSVFKPILLGHTPGGGLKVDTVYSGTNFADREYGIFNVKRS